MFAVTWNFGSSHCSVAPSMEYVCALVLWPVCVVYCCLFGYLPEAMLNAK